MKSIDFCRTSARQIAQRWWQAIEFAVELKHFLPTKWIQGLADILHILANLVEGALGLFFLA